MVYDINGNPLAAAYDINGNPLSAAYDIDGINIYSAATPDATSIKVMSYNVGQWYTGTGVVVPAEKDAEYYSLQKSMIDAIDADILVLQEYRDNMSETGRTALSMLINKYPYQYAKTVNTGIYFGRAIYSKYPLSGYTVNTYSQSDAAGRYYDKVTVRVGDTPISVINTHLALTLSYRDAQIAEVIAYIKSLGGHFILCGDLNMMANATWEEAYDSIVAPMLAEGWHLANGESEAVTTYYGDGSELLALDNIISDLPISGVYTDTTKLTDDISDTIDHVPLVATVELGT